MLSQLQELAGPSTTQALVWQTVVGVAMVSANFLVLKLMISSCRQDKAELSGQFKEALSQNAKLADAALLLAEEIRRERSRTG